MCAPPWVVRRLSNLRCVGSFFAYVWGEKKGVTILFARGTTQIRGGVGQTYRGRILGRRRSYFRAMTCRGTYSIGAEPGGCDSARIKLHYGMKLRRAGISGRVSAWKQSGVITILSHCVINLTKLIAHHLFGVTGKVAEVCYRN